MREQAEVVVLGLLADGPRHGYEIARRLKEMNVHQWAHIGTATVYNTLSRLAARGAVISHMEPGDKRPDRRVYTLTPAGRTRMQYAVERLMGAQTSLYSDRLVGLAFVRLLPAERARAAVAAVETFTTEAIRTLQANRRKHGPDDPVSDMVLAFYLDVFRAERRAARAVSGAARQRKAPPRRKPSS
jgi:DNA-binding PadR family transcriptional regulator